MKLEMEGFTTIGGWLKEFGPCAIILEGGYSRELPELIDAFLTPLVL